MSKKVTVRERTPVAQRIGMVALLLQLLFGGVMTLGFYSTGWVYGLLAGLTLVVAFIWFVGKDARGGRITARILVGVAYAFAGIPLLEMVLGLVDGWVNISFAKCVSDLCCLSLPVLLWLAAAVGYMALSRGKYDRFVACFTQVWILLILGLTFGFGLDIPWLLVGDAFAAILVGVTVFATVMVWLCALRRPREISPLDMDTTLQLDE